MRGSRRLVSITDARVPSRLYGFRNSCGILAMLMAIRRAPSRVSSRPSGQQHGGGLKRSGHKRNRAEVEHSTYGDDNKNGETKLEQSFA
jgi:hypothetical protein